MKTTHGAVKVHILVPGTVTPPFYGLCSTQVNVRPANLATTLSAEEACPLCMSAYLRNVLASYD